MLFLNQSFEKEAYKFMKKLTLVFLLVSCLSGRAQTGVFDDWFVTFGFNAVNSLGTLSPFNSPEDWAFRTPFSASVEKQWDRDFTIELAINLNGIKEDRRFDPGPAPETFTYFSVDTNVKYYFGRHIFRRGYDKIDFYADGGLGFFSIDNTNIAINFGGGVLFWLDEENKFGIRLQLIGKFAFNNADSGFDNNHYQWGLHGVYRL